ncbi:hypothetical protein FDF31_03820 [Clostridium sporogenes]|nr:hypothetical protein [Clostridium sporogenes]NFS24801.1 hypothetical protein [Clostridium sporogenes]
MNKNYKKEIEDDFLKVKSIINPYLIESDLDLQNVYCELQQFHELFYILRDILDNIKTVNLSSIQAIEDGIEGIFDFVWLMSFARYKSAVGVFRSASEMLIKGLLRQFDNLVEKDSFSNNVDIFIKEVRLNTEKKIIHKNDKEKLKKFLIKNYGNRIKQFYWNLSDIVHGRISLDKDFSKYLEDILDYNINHNQELYLNTIYPSVKLIQCITELYIIGNYEYLDKNMNTYKLSLICDSLSTEFKDFKHQYLLL